MELVKVESKQKVRVERRGKNRFRVKFEGKPVEVSTETADYLVSMDPTTYSIVGKPYEGEEKKDVFLAELQAIKGIGEKTAEDISRAFFGVKEIKSALKLGPLPFRDDVAKLLKEKYGDEEK